MRASSVNENAHAAGGKRHAYDNQLMHPDRGHRHRQREAPSSCRINALHVIFKQFVHP